MADLSKSRNGHENMDKPRTFPTPGSSLFRLIMDPEYRKTFHNRLKMGNAIIIFFYKSGILPLFGFGKQILLLTTLGRKSGKMRSTPIGYYLINNIIHVFSVWGRESNWYLNLTAHPEQVSIQMGFKKMKVRIETLEDPRDLQLAFELLAVQNPRGAKSLIGWDPEIDNINTADLSMLVDKVLVVRILPASVDG
jgi:deazaflavin-dependent oxidoreductase (nitroreductase family)